VNVLGAGELPESRYADRTFNQHADWHPASFAQESLKQASSSLELVVRRDEDVVFQEHGIGDHHSRTRILTDDASDDPAPHSLVASGLLDNRSGVIRTAGVDCIGKCRASSRRVA
jgi:hypothetical protein